MIGGLIGTIISSVLPIIDKIVPDKAEATRLKAELSQSLIDQQTELNNTMREITLKELGGTKFQSYWRPTLSWMFIVLLLDAYLIRPYLLTFGLDVPQPDTAGLIQIGTVWSAVYGMGRSFEKSGSKVIIGGLNNDGRE